MYRSTPTKPLATAKERRIAFFVIGNWILVTYGITSFAEEWAPGES